jgi:hypothetical protein
MDPNIMRMVVAARSLPDGDRAILHRALTERTDHFVGLMSAYAGVYITVDDCARLMLQLAKRALAPGGAS